MASKLVDAFLVYQLVNRLITPFQKWDAYKLGIIDKNGTVLKPRNTLTPQEENAWGFFDILVANIKKLIAKAPGGKSRLVNFAAAAFLMREHKKYDVDSIDQLTEACAKHLNMINEDVAVNNAGGGNVAGIGVGPKGEPPGKTAVMKQARMLMRNKLNVANKIPT